MNTALPREKRKQQIERALAIKTLESKAPMSMRQIARAVDMAQCGTFMNLLWDMVDDGRLIANPRAHRPNVIAWDFQIAPHRVNLVVGQAYEVQNGH